MGIGVFYVVRMIMLNHLTNIKLWALNMYLKITL